jgi:hypothetical protein
MSVVVILNIALAVIVMSGILALLSWGIASDKPASTESRRPRRTAAAKPQQRHRSEVGGTADAPA